MLSISSGMKSQGRTDVLFRKDGNKLGKRKYNNIRDIFHDVALMTTATVKIYNYNKYTKDKTIWSVYGVGYVFTELNDRFLTFEEALEIVYNYAVDDIFDEFFIFIQGDKKCQKH